MKNYIVKVLNGMALGLFSSLIIGLILKQIGEALNIEYIYYAGDMAQRLMGPAIGAGVAYSTGAKGLVLFSSIVAGALGAGSINSVNGQVLINIGEPVGAFFSALIASEIGNRIVGKTKIDIIIVPTVVIIVGAYVGIYLSPVISSFMNYIGELINFATTQKPFIMGIIISVVMGISLTFPISSAAIGISLNLTGLAAGASVVGCCCHMIGFAVASYKDNGFGGLISQGIGTSMIQMPNIIKKPIIALPAIISSAILGPLATTILKIESNAIGSGMGTSGLVGTISTIGVMGKDSIGIIILIQFILPALISYLVYSFLYKKGLIMSGDMKLQS